MCRNTVKIPMAKRKIIRGIVFSGAWFQSSMSPAHIKSNKNMQQMVQNLFKFRGQTLTRYLELKEYLTSSALNIPISVYHCKILTGIAPKECSNEWP